MRRPQGRSGFVTLILGFGLFGVLGGAVCAWLSDFHHLADLVAMFAAPAFTSALIGLALSAVARRGRFMLGYLGAAVALALALRPQWSPEQPAAAPAIRPSRVYFANVWAQNGDVNAIARSAQAADADVIALVEITDDHARALSRIAEGYPYRSNSEPARYFAGGPRVLVASKWPLRRSAEIPDGLAVEDVMVSAPSGEFRLIAAHLTRPWPLDGRKGEQRDQTERMTRRIAAGEADSVLLVGDFNATASSDLLQDFAAAATLRPARAVAGTWPNFMPAPFRIAIDNAFVGPGLTVLNRRLGEANGSDHRPIIVEVAPAG